MKKAYIIYLELFNGINIIYKYLYFAVVKTPTKFVVFDVCIDFILAFHFIK